MLYDSRSLPQQPLGSTDSPGHVDSRSTDPLPTRTRDIAIKAKAVIECRLP